MTVGAAIVTPVHRGALPYLGAAGRSLEAQRDVTFESLVWLIGVNGGVSSEDVEAELRGQENVRRIIVDLETFSGRIGALKAALCNIASKKASLIVELDADDLLEPLALRTLLDEWRRYRPAMLYSACAQFEDKGLCGPALPYRKDYGWQSVKHQGEALPIELHANVPWPSHPMAFSQMIFAPDHVRAWDSEAYRQVGGHNSDLEVADDLDLTQRIALARGFGSFQAIPECLYLYRKHGQQRTTELASITRASEDLYWRRRIELWLRWAGDVGLEALDLGGALNPFPGFESVDLRAGAKHQVDLAGPLPWAADSVGVARASHVLEHLADPLVTMRELHRVLVHGGLLSIEVPCATGVGAFMDPTHKSFWTRETFAYYTDPAFRRFIPPPAPTFQLVRLRRGQLALGGSLSGTMVPTVQADLVAVKDGPRLPGPI